MSDRNKRETSPESGKESLTSGKLLAKNTIWHLFGQVIPLIVALISIPILIGSLGTDKFGVLTLAWLVIGYFSFFDMGLGRALTKLVSEKLGAGEEGDIIPLIWTAVLLLLVPGVIGATGLIVLSPWLVHSLFKIPEYLQAETLTSFYLFALAVPLVVATEALIGVLVAKQRHDLVNAVKIPMGILLYLGPVMVLPFSQNLIVIISVLILVRIFAMTAYLFNCIKVYPGLWHKRQLQRKNFMSLVKFGSWMTVNNFIDPFMVKADRFLIGAMVSVTAVAFYSTPYEAVTKLWVVPTAIISVLYPAFAASFAQDRNRMAVLYYRGFKYIMLALFPLSLLIVLLAHEGLNIWLGPEFAENSTLVLQLLGIGVFINSLSQVPFVLVQGTGRPDITAKLHFVEFIIYMGALIWVVRNWGIEGAALVWLIRASIDFLILVVVTQRMHFRNSRLLNAKTICITLAILLQFSLAMLISDPIAKFIFLLAAAVAFSVSSWLFILARDEKQLVKKLLKRPLNKVYFSRK